MRSCRACAATQRATGTPATPRSAAAARSAASRRASPPIQASVAAASPPPKKTAQKHTAAAPSAGPSEGPSPPARSPAARTAGDASIGQTTRSSRSQTVYIGITARTPTSRRLRADPPRCGVPRRGRLPMTTTARATHGMIRLLLAAFVATLALLAAGVGSASAAPAASLQATSTCWQQVINDWLDNGQVDRIYAIPCYTQAIQHLSQYPDVAGYSSAEDDIRRALQAAFRLDRGGGGGTGPGGGGGGGPSGGGATGIGGARQGAGQSVLNTVLGPPRPRPPPA